MAKDINFIQMIIHAIQGAIIGVGAILPGVSGGVLCVAFGIYEPMMELLSHPFKALKKNYPYRIIDVKWNSESCKSPEIKIKIVGHNELGLLGSISNTIKDLHINILNANFETKENRFVGNLVLQVNNTNLLEQLLRKLRSLKGVIEVDRLS